MSLKGTYGVDWSHARPSREQLTRDRTFTWTTGGKTVQHVTDGGMRFACRYLLDEGRNAGKALHRDEALAVNSWGIPIASNFEYSVGGVLGGASQGTKDATTALAEITEMGIPRRDVYFSADVDLSISQIPAVLAYGEAAAKVLGSKSLVHFYGEYDLIEAAGKAGFGAGWQCYAWSRGLWSKYAAVRQIRNHIFPDFDGDLNLAMADDIGAWSLISVEADMDMNTLTPSGSPTYGMTYGDAVKAMLRGANASTAAAAAVARLEAGEAADDQRDLQQHAELKALFADVIELVDAIQLGDPAQLADALAEKLGPKLDASLLDALHARLAA